MALAVAACAAWTGQPVEKKPKPKPEKRQQVVFGELRFALPERWEVKQQKRGGKIAAVIASAPKSRSKTEPPGITLTEAVRPAFSGKGASFGNQAGLRVEAFEVPNDLFSRKRSTLFYFKDRNVFVTATYSSDEDRSLVWSIVDRARETARPPDGDERRAWTRYVV